MAASNKPTLGKSEITVIRELAEILRETDLSDIEVSRGDLTLKISRRAAKQVITTGVTTAGTAPVPQPQPIAPETPAPKGSVDMSAHPGAVRSPMVGTTYLASEPGKPPFVKVGDTVAEGDTLMLIEAMKTFNPIAAPTSGKIIDLMVEDGQPVEFDEILVVIG